MSTGNFHKSFQPSKSLETGIEDSMWRRGGVGDISEKEYFSVKRE
jgi:hypothetical protein